MVGTKISSPFSISTHLWVDTLALSLLGGYIGWLSPLPLAVYIVRAAIVKIVTNNVDIVGRET